MQKRMMVVLATLVGLTAMIGAGCSRGPAEGKLQIMYSGNIRGAVAPCG
ncbi:hypothetical protein KKH27_13930 [bacterium]|nr:hypothetical protein [bacterium]MBU1983977.1 hypothetical protein [bacterium]